MALQLRVLLHEFNLVLFVLLELVLELRNLVHEHVLAQLHLLLQAFHLCLEAVTLLQIFLVTLVHEQELALLLLLALLHVLKRNLLHT